MTPCRCRSALTVGLLCTLAHVASAAAQTEAPVASHLAIPDATVLSVRVGVDITVRRADGTVETIPWADVHAQAPAPNAPATHVNVTVGTDPPRAEVPAPIPQVPALSPTEPFSLDPAPGLVAVDLVSNGAPLAINPGGSFFQGSTMRTAWPSGIGTYGPLVQLSPYLCTTPCRLYVRPGGVTLHVGGAGQWPTDVTFEARGEGQRVVLRSLSLGRPAGGLVLTAFGVGAMLSGGMMALMGSMTAPPGSSSYPGGAAASEDHSIGDVGVGVLIASVPLLVSGIVLLSTSRTGIVEDSGRHEEGVHFAGAAIAPTSDGTAWAGRVAFTF